MGVSSSLTPMRSFSMASLHDFELVTPDSDLSFPGWSQPAEWVPWHDLQGNLVARTTTVGQVHIMDFEGLAIYAHEANSTRYLAYSKKEGRDSLVRQMFYRSALPFLLQAQGCEALHASAVLVKHRVFAFCATSGTGKSTLVNKLYEEGYTLWTDDSLVFEMRAGASFSFVIPFHPRRDKIGPSWARSFVPANALDEMRDHLDPLNGLSAPIGAIFIMERVRSADSSTALSLVRLAPAEAITAVLEQAYVFSLHSQERKRRMLDVYLRLVRDVPVYRLSIPNSLERLSEVVSLLKPLLGPPAP